MLLAARPSCCCTSTNASFVARRHARRDDARHNHHDRGRRAPCNTTAATTATATATAIVTIATIATIATAATATITTVLHMITVGPLPSHDTPTVHPPHPTPPHPRQPTVASTAIALDTATTMVDHHRFNKQVEGYGGLPAPAAADDLDANGGGEGARGSAPPGGLSVQELQMEMAKLERIQQELAERQAAAAAELKEQENAAAVEMARLQREREAKLEAAAAVAAAEEAETARLAMEAQERAAALEQQMGEAREHLEKQYVARMHTPTEVTTTVTENSTHPRSEQQFPPPTTHDPSSPSTGLAGTTRPTPKCAVGSGCSKGWTGTATVC